MTDAYANRVAAHADSPLSLDEQALVADWLKPLRPRAILDVAAGPGVVLSRLCERVGANGVAVDADPAMGVDVARAEVLPFAEGVFDHVLFQHAIGHVEDAERALAEIRRVLRPGGTLSVVATNRWYKLWRWPMNLICGYRPDPRERRSFSRRRVFAMLDRAGFAVERFEWLGPRAWGWCGPRLRMVLLACRSAEPRRTGSGCVRQSELSSGSA